MKNLKTEIYTHAEIIRMLKQNREIKFYYELLDKSERPLGEVSVTSGRIDFDSGLQVMRTGNFDIKERKNINYIDERIKPYFCLLTPFGWVRYPLGVFLISSPQRITEGYGIRRSLECYDKAVILREDRFEKRYFIPKGTVYTTEVIKIINSSGIIETDITPSMLQCNVDIEFEIGTTKLGAINELLKAVNYNYLYFDENGVAKSNEYVNPYLRGIEEEYVTDRNSITKLTASETMDAFNFPNVLIRYLNNPEAGNLISKYSNDNPSSILSTVRRGRKIVDIETVTDIADQTTLDNYVVRVVQEKQLSETLQFVTALMPHHSYCDCLMIQNKELNTNGRFIETGWSMELRTGGDMEHICRKVVQI